MNETGVTFGWGRKVRLKRCVKTLRRGILERRGRRTAMLLKKKMCLKERRTARIL